MGITRTNTLIGLLFMGVLMGALDLAIIGPALPAIQAEFGMTGRQLSVLYNAYILSQLVGLPLLAKLSGRFGARAIYIFSILCFAVGSLMLVVATEPAWLYFGRAIQGFGAGGIFPVAAAVIGSELPRKERGPALGLIGVVFGLAFLLGPVLGGLLLRFSWHWLFLINLPIAVVLIGGAMKLLPNSKSPRRGPFDLGGAITITIALSALVVALNRFDSAAVVESLRSPMILALLTVSVGSTWMFWRIEKRAQDPILRPAFFESRQITLSCLIAAGVGAVQSASVFSPAFAVSALAVSQSDAALLMLPGVLAATIASPIVGRLLNYVGTRIIVVTGLMLVYVSLMIYGLTDLHVTTFVGASICSGIGMAGLVGAPLRLAVLDATAPRDRGSSQGLLNIFFSVGRLLGAAIVGGIATSYGGGTPGYQTAFLLMAIPTAALIFIATRLKSRNTENDDAGSENQSPAYSTG